MRFSLRGELPEEWRVAFMRSALAVALVNDIEVRRVPLLLLPVSDGWMQFTIDVPVIEGDKVIGQIVCGENLVAPSQGLTIDAAVSVRGSIELSV